jgi:predicted Zn-dependent peptidase
MKKIKSKKVLESALTPVFKKTTLDNGVRVVTENHVAARGVAVGFWVGCGTRDEEPRLQGVSHFVEHLVFKRTKKRSAYQIARDMEAVGGDLNAFTSRESTCFHTHSLKEHLGLSIDVLSDLVSAASFHKDDFEKEKQVVIQEIHMTDEQLEDSIFDIYFQKAYGNNPLGWQILGTEKTITQMKRADVVDYYEQMYVGSNMIISVAGALEHDQVVKLIEKQFKPQISSQKIDFIQSTRKPPKLKAFKDFIQKPSEQVHILMGLPASDFSDSMRFESYIVNTLLGGGMTSKLYQSIREERGLAYSIYSHLSTFTDSGLLMIYAGTESKNVKKVVELTEKELKRLQKNGVSRADLDLFKTQVKGQILLGADDVENRMNSLGVNEMVFGEYRSVEKVMNDIDKISLDSIHHYIEKYIDPDQLGLLLMGSFKEKKSRPTF